MNIENSGPLQFRLIIIKYVYTPQCLATHFCVILFSDTAEVTVGGAVNLDCIGVEYIMRVSFKIYFVAFGEPAKDFLTVSVAKW